MEVLRIKYDPSMVFVLELATVLTLRDEKTLEALGENLATTLGWLGSALPLAALDVGVGRSGFTTMTAGAFSSGSRDSQ
jgi:hypothetical protein